MQPITGKITALENLFALAVQRSHAEQEAQRLKALEAKKKKKYKYGEIEPDIPVDFSFFQLASLEDAEGENPRLPEMIAPRDETDKFDGRTLRLNNNELTELTLLPLFVQKNFTHPEKMAWLDLSFNSLTIIDSCLLDFPNLQILYLHGNKIDKLSEVDKLAGLPKLRKLTLHGNPIDQDKSYMMYVTSTLPRLSNISFSAVTKCQAATASSWQRMNNPNKKKKKKRDD